MTYHKFILGLNLNLKCSFCSKSLASLSQTFSVFGYKEVSYISFSFSSTSKIKNLKPLYYFYSEIAFSFGLK